MLDHIGFAVKDFEASRRFYVEALAPLGVGVAMGYPGHVALGRDGKPQLWPAQGEPASPCTLPLSLGIARKSTPFTPPR